MSSKKKGGVDWTVLNETNECRRDFESDSDGELQDHHLFTVSESQTLMGRSASPGHPPYGAAKIIRKDVSKRHESTTKQQEWLQYQGLRYSKIQ